MKVRKGFVSNSSSSSFICDVCGEDVSGMDLSLEETGMVECENGHTVCTGHLVNLPEERKPRSILTVDFVEKELKKRSEGNKVWVEDYEAWKNKTKEEKEDSASDYYYDFEVGYDFPKEHCPICQYKTIYTPRAYKFLITHYELTDEDVLDKMKEAKIYES